VNLFTDQPLQNILPHFYNYGSLYLYLTNIVTSFAIGYGYIGSLYKMTGEIDPSQVAKLYLVGRLLTAVMGIATVWVVWAAARRTWGISAAFFGAIALATMPLHVQHSHFLTVDVPATLWIALSLYWSLRIVQDQALFDRPAPKCTDDIPDAGPVPIWQPRKANPWILAGLFAGLAMATKYNAALVILPLLVAGHYRRGDNLWGAVRGTVAGLVSFGIAFLVACPGSILERERFLRDIAYEGNHVYQHGEPAFQHVGPGWLYIITHNLMAGMGLPMLALSLIAIAFAICRHKPEDMVLVAFALPYYILISAAQSKYARYDIPLLPVLALWLGALTQQALAASRTTKERWAVTALGGAVILFTNAVSTQLIAPMTRPDPRDIALHRLGDFRNHTYGFATMPWFYTPPIRPLFTLPGPGQWEPMAHRWEAVHILTDVNSPFDAEGLRYAKPDVVLLSEFEYAAPLRLGDAKARAFVAELRADYHPPIVVGTPTGFVPLMHVDGLPVQSLPYDMLYTNPQTLIFVRKGASIPLRASPTSP
jgi:hypothetical protein